MQGDNLNEMNKSVVAFCSIVKSCKYVNQKQQVQLIYPYELKQIYRYLEP